MAGKSLTGQLKDKLIQQALERKLKHNDAAAQRDHHPTSINPFAATAIPETLTRFDQHSGYKQMQIIHKGSVQLGIENPFFRVHDGIAGATTQIKGRAYINYASYNYLGLSSDTRVSQAAKEVIDQYGTSVSASRP